jgi:hypothetical protein
MFKFACKYEYSAEFTILTAVAEKMGNPEPSVT